MKQLSLLCGCLAMAPLNAQTVIESFEYSSSEELQAYWYASPNAVVSTSDSVAEGASGPTSMRVDFNFPSTAFATEWIDGPELFELVSIDPNHYVSFRVKGDPAFAAADFRFLYVYAYDLFGNFGRWGGPVPVTDQWHTVNYLASSVEKPWNSPELPDLTQIIRFAFYQYGSEAAIPEYAASIHLDDLAIRETPLVEEPTGPIEQVIDAYEYPDADSLLAAWTPTGNTTLAPTTAISGRSAGTTAMEATFNFPSMEWATEIIAGAELPVPISIASTQYLSFRLRGDAAFSGSDFRTLFLYAYDAAGNFGRWGVEVPTTADWQIVNHLASAMEQPWDSPTPPDLNQIVRFSWFQYGSQAAIPEYTAAIAIDDFQVRHTPLVDAPLSPDTILETFEYDSEALPANWIGGANTIVSASDDVSHNATGSTSMKLEFNFPSMEWATETVRGPIMETPVSIAPGQFIAIRVKGDPAFSVSDFRNLYFYAYDAEGNFGRWGAPVPDTDEWRVINFAVNAIEKPWDSPALPDLSQITQFAFYQYGSQAALDPYSATVYIDEIMLRNSPLNEFPAPSDPRNLIENFESYADESALLAAYTYVNSPATTFTTAALESPAPEGSKALALTIDFSSGQYPWGSVRSLPVAPFSFPTNGVLTARFKGDPVLAEVADEGTSFWISFYDQSGRGMNFVSPASVVTNGDWMTLEATLDDFGDTSSVDIGNLTQWRILVQGWEGTVDNAPLTGTFLVDDIRIETADPAPSLAIARDGNSLTVTWPEGASDFTLESSPAVTDANWEPVQGAANNQATVTPDGVARFFRLRK